MLACVNICIADETCEAVQFLASNFGSEPVFSTIPEFSTQSPFGEGGIGGFGMADCEIFKAGDLPQIIQFIPDPAFGGTFATKPANTEFITGLMGFGPDTVLPAEDVPESAVTCTEISTVFGLVKYIDTTPTRYSSGNTKN